MLYDTPDAWLSAPQRSVALIGMSGVGKTRLSSILREEGEWFHYSVDYRIGTRYLGERITDEFKREAMKSPKLRELLRSDSLSIRSKLSFHNLTPLSTWLALGDSWISILLVLLSLAKSTVPFACSNKVSASLANGSPETEQRMSRGKMFR